MKNFDEFVDKLMLDKGFENKDAEVLAQIKADLSSRLEDRINAMILSNLSENDLVEFGAILDSKDMDKMEKFTFAHIPDINEKIASELLTFRNMYIS